MRDRPPCRTVSRCWPAFAAVVLLAGCGGNAFLLRAARAGDKPAFRLLGKFPFKRSLKMKTLGGRQFWGDVAWFRGWRIQQNVLTRHYRLLDPEDYRYASGTLAECKKELQKIKKKRKLAPMRGKAVILVHGIIRSSKSMGKLSARLKKEGYMVVGFDYPSTRVDIPASAAYLQKVVASLEGIERIDFVAHSMGGLIVRQLSAQCKDKRIKRMVMLGVPNNGAQLADKFQRIGLYKAIFGPAGQQLVTDEAGLIKKLPVPACEFAIIAGSRGNPKGYNPLIPGDDDGTVSVASARLPGAADFMTVRSLHSFMMGNEEAIEASVRFLEKGCLRADGTRQPIPKKNDPAPAKRPGRRTGSKG